MKKKSLYFLVFLILIVAILFAIQVPQKNFSELYSGEKNIEKSLLAFREIPTKRLVHNEADWEYVSTGKGKKYLLFLHGMGGAYDIWWQQIEALKNEYHIISTTMPEVHSIDEAIDGLKAILDAEGVEKVSIIGSSMGGYMAQYFYKKYPERLEKVVFGNTFPPNDIYKKENGGIRKLLPFMPEWVIMKIFRGSLSEKITPFSENSPLVEAYLLEQYSGYMKKGQFIGRLDVVLDLFETNYSEMQKSIPKLIIEADNDPLVNPVLQQQLKTLYSEAKVFTFKGKGHFPYLNQPEKYTEILTSFLKDTTKIAIEKTIHNYFYGRKTGDIELLKKAFHPTAQLVTTDESNELKTISLEDYFSTVKKQGAVECETQLLSLTYKGTQAEASTLFDYGKVVYLDTLTLSKIDGHWQIMNKRFLKK